jgi:hypothetical protein
MFPVLLLSIVGTPSWVDSNGCYCNMIAGASKRSNPFQMPKKWLTIYLHRYPARIAPSRRWKIYSHSLKWFYNPTMGNYGC